MVVYRYKFEPTRTVFKKSYLALNLWHFAQILLRKILNNHSRTLGNMYNEM